ncbi:tubulin-specific chaperone c-like [Plakobranchus ocellatus]|uniref:Tubulin-specific chaperone c-like n=1 Tax=Plakobranchus ocellatus TaxID=259542 RepID=A0AAV4DV11_9GAST|nr:tubulin-specific chaperone c-like [Plakobranchus ocellatus]
MADWKGTIDVPNGTPDDLKSGVAERLQKREDERQTLLRKRREEQDDLDEKVQDSLHSFLEILKSERLSLEKSLAESSSLERSKLIDHFDALSLRVQKLQRNVSESALFLPPYELKTAQNVIVLLQSKIQETRDQLLPKKKFAFTKKQNKKPALEGKQSKDIDLNSAKNVLSKSDDDLVVEFTACKFVDRTGETLQKNANEINQKDIALVNLANCTVLLYGAPSAVHINKLNKCTIFCGPVPGSIFIRDCVECTFVLACQQLRIHSTTNTEFYIHVTSKAIIEDCNKVKFAPYNWKYDTIEEDYNSTGLSKQRNNWDKVDDFNWLVADVHSPNWSVIPSIDRVTSWKL